MNVARLLLVHALLTLAAAVVLVLAPGLIPGAVGVVVTALSASYGACGAAGQEAVRDETWSQGGTP